MSDKPKYPRADAIAVAKELCDALKPVTERLIVAGSLRRGKAEVGDVEILYIPRFIDRQEDMFSMTQANTAEELIATLLENNVVIKRPNIRGGFTWGGQNKLAVHHSGIPVDLFATTAEKWWVALVIRTGSKALNLRLTMGANDRNRTLNAYGCGVTESDGHVIPATSEEHVFELCGVPYLPPHERNIS